MPKLIISADWHLRDKAPRCRMDENWESFQRNLVSEIVTIANNKKCPLVIVGDLFDSPNCPARIISMAIEELSKIKYTVHFLAGNHDLPYHSIENLQNSSIGIFSSLSKEHNKIVHGMDDFGQWIDFNDKVKGDDYKLLFIHRLVFQNTKSLPPNVQASTAQDLLDEFYQADWIFTGDNHTSFVYKKGQRQLINPGSIYRGSSDQKDYKPSVYFVDTDNEKIEQIFLSDTQEIVDDSYIIEQDEKEERISAFVEKLKKNEAIELDFMKNIEKALLINKKLSKETVNMINYLCSEKEE
jgi:DNA repair exonuclease SbcCD nuclease subunit